LIFSVGLDDISVGSGLIPVVAGIITYRQHSFILKAFLFFLILGVFNDGVSILKHSSILLGNFFSLIELLVYSALFLPVVFKKSRNLIIFTISLMFCVYFIVTTIYSGGANHVNTIFNVSECVLLLIIAGLLLLKISLDSFIALNKNPLFWVGTGMLIYSLSFLAFVVVDIEIKDKTSALNSLWGIHSIVNIAANIFYSIAFLCRSPKKILSS
jgi:hypothetical protein